MEFQPVEFIQRRLPDLMADARADLGEYLNVPGDDLVYVPNATHGINIVAKSLPLEAGDEILTTDHEYGALDLTWEFYCGKSGAIYRRVPIPVPVTTPEAFVDYFWSGVTARTRVIFLSHITSPTAITFPVKEICRRARAAGILTVIDGAHAVSQWPIDLADIDPDVYTGNNHKWLCAPKGSAPTPRKNRPFLTSPRSAAASWVSMQNWPQPAKPSRSPHCARQSKASVQRGLTCTTLCSLLSAFR